MAVDHRLPPDPPRTVPDALYAAQARFEAVAAQLRAALCVTDADDRAVYVNAEMEALTGYAAHELLGAEIGPLLLAPEDHARLSGRYGDRRDGRSERYEVTHRRRDGTQYLVEVSASPLTDESGRFIGTVGVLTDVTDTRVREVALAAREQRYRALFEASPLPSWVYEVETRRFLAVNPAAVARYGYTEAEFLAMRLDDIRPPDELARFLAYERSMHEFDVARGYRHRTRGGEVFPVEVMTHPMEFEGRVARIAVVYDVSERERIRIEQAALAEQLQQAQKMEAVGRLAGGVAHDFNNLLSVVLAAAEQLDAELPDWSPLREDVRDVREAAQRGAALTRQLLALGRRETRVARLVELGSVLTEAERLLIRALGRDVALEIERGDAPLHVVVDPSQLEQGLVNLAFNARDALPDGGTVRIAMRAAFVRAAEAEALGVAAGRYAVLEVADDGAGMDEATRQRAFEPFFSTKPRANGSGLGLSTVYGIVRQSRGAVSLESAPGHGTCVRVYLPLADGPAPALPARPAADGGGRRGRLLLVEDETAVRAQAARLLRRAGFTVEEAEDGEAGARMFESDPARFDAVVSDVMMPVLNGAEMVARMRRVRADLPVVYVSGYAAEDAALELDSRTRFIAKPYAVAALCDAIDLLTGARAD